MSLVLTGLYDVHDKLQRTYSRFNDDAFSARFRRDAKLICAGDKSGSVRVFDTDSKAMLREMKHHTAAVRCTVWSCDGTNILSASDDKKVLRWDLATETMLWNSRSCKYFFAALIAVFNRSCNCYYCVI